MWLKPLTSSFVHHEDTAGPAEEMLYQPEGEFSGYLTLALVRGEGNRGCTSACTSLEPFCLFTQDKRAQSSLSELVCDFLRYAAAQTAWPDCHLAEILLSKISDNNGWTTAAFCQTSRPNPKSPLNGLQPKAHVDTETSGQVEPCTHPDEHCLSLSSC